MKQLSHEAYKRAQQYLLTYARPLERVMYHHRFGSAAMDDVLIELAHFQNEDGGFGQALEPDLRTPDSSALTTGIGLQLLRDLECQPGHPMVSKAVSYLIRTFDEKARIWRVAASSTNDHPHAPWWHDEGGSLGRMFDGFSIIPRALITGLLHHYSTLVPAVWLDGITEETVSTIETVEILGDGGGSDLEYAINLAESENLPGSYAVRLKARIRKAIPKAVCRNPEQWNSYCITPLRLASSPHTLGTDLIWDDLQRNLDFQIAHQTPEGCWQPTWTWGGLYPEVWKQARQEWCGKLTLQTLIQLDAFGRIEI
jgi:hypothetical protein